MDDDNRPDFSVNEEWVDMKILMDGTTDNNKIQIQERTYTTPIKKVLKNLKIVASHFGHWGCVHGPVELAFEEVPPELIRILGKKRG
jgi:hypothetical protein